MRIPKQEQQNKTKQDKTRQDKTKPIKAKSECAILYIPGSGVLEFESGTRKHKSTTNKYLTNENNNECTDKVVILVLKNKLN